VHPLHSLTPLTGREAAEKRTVVIGTVELNARLAMILGIATPIGFLAAAISWPFLSQYAVFVFPITLFAAAFLFYRRTSDGMNLHTYQALLDKKRSSDVGKVYLCGHEVDVNSINLSHLRHNTAPYRIDTGQTAPIISSTAAAPPRARGRRAPVDGHAFHGGFETNPAVEASTPAPSLAATSTAPAAAATLTRATETFTDTMAGLKGAGERVTGALRPRRRRIEDDAPDAAEPAPLLVAEAVPAPSPDPAPVSVAPAAEPVTAPVVPTPAPAPVVPAPAAVPVAPAAAPVIAPPVAQPVAQPVARPEPAPVFVAPPAQPAPVQAVQPVQPAPVAPVYVESRPEVDMPRQAPYRPAPAPVPVAVEAPEPVAVPEPEPQTLGFDGPAPTGDPATDFDAGAFFDQPTTRRKRGNR
jgi:hypothetical protein